MIKQYKNIIILAIAIVVVAAGAIVIPRIVRHAKNAAPVETSNEVAANAIAEQQAVVAAPVDTRTPAERQKAYDDTLAANKDVTIRLGDKCAITIPVKFTVAKGTRVLIVNSGTKEEALDMKTGEKGSEKTQSVLVRPSHYSFRTVTETTSLGCNGLSTAALITVK
jgi:hypothetical protein